MSLASNLAALGRLLKAAANGIVTGATPAQGDNSTALATTAWMKAEQAAETTQGTAKVATQAQTNAGADDTTIVTPKKLRAGFNISLGSSGYLSFPTWLGGLILQWGSLTTSSSGDVGVSYPIAFPNAAFCVAFGCQTLSTVGNVSASAIALAGMNVGGYTSGGRVAIGSKYLVIGW